LRANDDRFDSWYSTFLSRKDFKNATDGFLNILAKFRRVRETRTKRKYNEIYFTHGFELILSLLHSKFCSSLTVYGFSKFPTYHYFDSPKKGVGRRVRPGHVMGMEYFILEELGRRGLPISLYAYE
jgi:hypothetical protein